MKNKWALGIIAVLALAVAAGSYYLFFQNQVKSQIEVQLRQFFANPPAPYTKATYEKLDLALATRTLTIDNIVLERSVAPFTIKIGHAEIAGFDANAWQALFDPAQYKENASQPVIYKIADSLTLTAVAMPRDKGALTAGKISAIGISLRQLSTKPDPMQIAAMSEAQRARLIFDIFHVDELTVENANLVPASGEGLGDFGRIVVKDFSRQRVGSFAIHKLIADDPSDDSHTTIARLELQDFRLGAWVDFVEKGSPADEFLTLINLGSFQMTDFILTKAKGMGLSLNIARVDMGRTDSRRLESLKISRLQFDEPRSPNGGITIGAIEISGFDWEKLLPIADSPDPLSKLKNIAYSLDNFSISDVGGSAMGFVGLTLKSLSFSLKTNNDSGKAAGSFTVDHLDMDRSKVMVPEIAKFLTALQYDVVSLSIDSKSQSDRINGGAIAGKVHFSAPKVGDIDIDLALAGYDPSLALSGMDGLMTLNIEHYHFVWTDHGLTQRWMKMIGDNNGTNSFEARDAVIKQVTLASNYYREQNAPQVADAMQGFADYLSKPALLFIDINPKPPVSFARYFSMIMNSNPRAVAEAYSALGITVRAQ